MQKKHDVEKWRFPMALSDIPIEEQALLDAVTDRQLRRCLDNLRPAIEGLWRPATPRIVKDFTDHGIEHYERIAVYVSNLLSAKAPQTTVLSSVEMFLLIAGIYLHDVGMQCDVTTEDGKQIRKRAEVFGADFGGVEFTATSANGYSLDEQKIIRKNHHYLSAAWIEYAHESGDTDLGSVLGSKAKLMPYDLVPDLMDVCLHHTTIPIENCQPALAGGGAGRKRLVSSLLRFADELDIASNRVDMAAVTQFSVSPDNAMFWWLHNLTIVTFRPPNIFRVTVRLNDTDFVEFASLVRSFYFGKFVQKNKDTLQILHDLGFPIVIDVYGDVISLRPAPSLPEDVRNAFRNIQLAKDGPNTDNSVSSVTIDSFHDPEHWPRLTRIGPWMLENKVITGAGVGNYLLSAYEYGAPFTITAHISFSGYSSFAENGLDTANAGIVLGWSDSGDQHYINLLFTGTHIVLERVGGNGFGPYLDFDYLGPRVPLPLEEGRTYRIYIDVSARMLTVFVDDMVVYATLTPAGLNGRVGLRPWRARLQCNWFEARRS